MAHDLVELIGIFLLMAYYWRVEIGDIVGNLNPCQVELMKEFGHFGDTGNAVE